MFRVFLSYLCFLFCIGISSTRADILPIQAFKTPSDLNVWLVEDHTSPVVTLILTFDKTTFISPNNPSLLLLSNTITRGAGVLTPLEMDRFSKETPSWANLTLGFSKNQLQIKTTKNGLKENLKLWSRLIGDPQFQKADLIHSKVQAIATTSFLNENLEWLAFLNLIKIIFPDFSVETDFSHMPPRIEALTAQDLEKENGRQLLTAKPKFVVVGDVTKKELIELLDPTFGALQLQNISTPKTSPRPHWNSKETLIEKDVSQTVIALGQPGISPKSKEYPLYLLLQNVLSTRMFDELREKRGLIYSIQFYENHYNNADLLTGIVSCECSQAQHIIKFLRSEWERIKDFGITQQELSNSKLSFKKSHILNLTSTTAVAEEYADPQAYGLPSNIAIGLLEKAEKITLKEINQFVNEALKPDLLTFVLIGPPLKLTPSKGKK